MHQYSTLPQHRPQFPLRFGYFDHWMILPVFWTYSDCACAETAISELPVEILTSLHSNPNLLKQGNNLALRLFSGVFFSFQCTDRQCAMLILPNDLEHNVAYCAPYWDDFHQVLKPVNLSVLIRFTVNTLHHAVTLTFETLTLNLCVSCNVIKLCTRFERNQSILC